MLSEQTRTEIGDRIRDVRISHKMTQAEFAESVDISINFLSEIENGRKGLSYETLYNLCYNLSVSADYILFGTENEGIDYQQIIDISNKLSINELERLIEYLEALKNLKYCDTQPKNS